MRDADRLWWFVALPVAYFAVVLVAVTAGVLFASIVRARQARAMDELQARAFGAKRVGLFERLRGLGLEAYYQSLVWLLSAAHRLRLLPAPRRNPEHTPVVVLPGYTENAGTMWWLGRRLAAAGFNPVLVDFPSTFRPIEENVEFLAQRIEEIRAEHGGREVAVVAHSMGGLVTRALVHRRADHGIAAVVAVASPFRGTHIALLARFLPLGRSVLQMRPGARFLASYPATLEPPLPLLSIVGQQETIVSPEWSVVIAGAQVRVLDHAFGHVTPLFSALAFEELSRFLALHGVTRRG